MDISSSTPALELEQVQPWSTSEVHVEESSNLPEGHVSSASPAPAPALEKEKKRKRTPGVRVVGSRIYDSRNGKTCHQCRQKTMDIMASCKNHTKGKQCTAKYCHKCLRNRYGEKAEEVVDLEDWICPKCKGICNCSFCRKKMGQQPTGMLVHTAKSTGFSSVSEMLLVKGSDFQPEKECTPKRKGKESRKVTKGKMVVETSIDITTDTAEGMHEDVEQVADVEIIPLPQGSELRAVAGIGIELQPEEVGHALQLLEYCSAFRELLGLKKEAHESILNKLLIGGGSGCIGESSPVAQFVVRLLSWIQKDLVGESNCLVIDHRLDHETSWILALHKYLSASTHLSGKLKLDQFDGSADSFHRLDTTQRLTLVNFVCDEFLCSRKARNWIDEQKLEHSEKLKETKQKIAAAKQKEKQLKQKMKDELGKVMSAKKGVPISSSEHRRTIVSQIEMEAAQAHAEMVELNKTLCREKQECSSVRTKPVLMDDGGRTFWRLNCCGGDDSNIFLQEVSPPDEPDFREKWFTYGEEEQSDKVQKYISSKEKR